MINGILVGCDDENIGGYEWVINKNDFDNSNPEIINKLEKYKTKKDFKIYFYVFKTPTEFPAKTSDEYRGTIFGRAEVKTVERYKNDPEKFKYIHHVKLKNFEHFDPKIKLEDIEEKLQKHGWTDEQKLNFGVNLSHHGLLLTKKDCGLLDSYNPNIVENNSGKDDAGLLIGYFHRPNRKGYEHIFNSREENDRGANILAKFKNMKGKIVYFYIFESCEDKIWTDSEWKNFKEKSNGKILGRIFGEGLIKDVVNDKIIYQYVTHYREYVDIDNVTKLSDRINEINKDKPIKSQKSVKGRINIGLPLTEEECNQISKLGGVM